jgi:hypothetical protein
MKRTSLFGLLVTALVATSPGCSPATPSSPVDVSSSDDASTEPVDEVYQPIDHISETTGLMSETAVEESDTEEVEIDPTTCDKVKVVFGTWYLYENDHRFEDLPAYIDGVPGVDTCVVSFELDEYNNESGTMEATDLPMVYDPPGSSWYVQFVLADPITLHVEVYDDNGSYGNTYVYVR